MTARAIDDEMTAERFRDVMAQVPAAVAVVTTSADGEPRGTTVSAFMSLSMDPPTVLISLANASSLLARLRTGSVAGINVLTADQADLAMRFASKRKDNVGVEWEHPEGQPPRLSAAHAWLAFTVTELIVVGDHTLVIGTVTTADATSEAPLIYWQRTFGTHTAT